MNNRVQQLLWARGNIIVDLLTNQTSACHTSCPQQWLSMAYHVCFHACRTAKFCENASWPLQLVHENCVALSENFPLYGIYWYLHGFITVLSATLGAISYKLTFLQGMLSYQVCWVCAHSSVAGPGQEGPLQGKGSYHHWRSPSRWSQMTTALNSETKALHVY